jgi:hypothetical protein
MSYILGLLVIAAIFAAAVSGTVMGLAKAAHSFNARAPRRFG